jgi:hypothetical protein
VNHRVDEQAVVLGGASGITGLARQQRLDALPLSIAQLVSMSHVGPPWPENHHIDHVQTPCLNVRSS